MVLTYFGTVATSKNQVYHLHRRMLDPRRPMQKPNAEEQEEMLIQYDAVLPPDPRRVITHKNQVSMNITRSILYFTQASFALDTRC